MMFWVIADKLMLNIEAWGFGPRSLRGYTMKTINLIIALVFVTVTTAYAGAAADYWRDRQYNDRLRAEDRSHELEIERIRATAAVEVAKRQRRYWHNYNQPIVIVPPASMVPLRPAPAPPRSIYSNSRVKRVPNASR